jgi:hypothetical protein
VYNKSYRDMTVAEPEPHQNFDPEPEQHQIIAAPQHWYLLIQCIHVVLKCLASLIHTRPSGMCKRELS